MRNLSFFPSLFVSLGFLFLGLGLVDLRISLNLGGHGFSLNTHVNLLGLRAGTLIHLGALVLRLCNKGAWILKDSSTLESELLGGGQVFLGFLRVVVVGLRGRLAHDRSDLLLGRLEELLSLQSSLELGTSGTRLCLYSYRLRPLLSLNSWNSLSALSARLTRGGRVEKQPDSGEAHEDILDVLIVLMLSHDLLAQVHLLLEESLLVVSIRVVVVPVDGSAPHFDAFSFAVSLADLEGVLDRFQSLFPELLASSDSSSLSANHALLVLLGHVFFVGD